MVWRSGLDQPPAAGNACGGCEDEISALERRTYVTYSARLKACNRLNYRARAWNALMISASLAGLIASAAMLRDPRVYGDNGDLLWFVVAIATFAGSLITASLNYSGRSRDMFLNYRKIQALSTELEMLKGHPDLHAHHKVVTLINSYNALLDESENHTSADYYKTLKPEARNGAQKLSVLLSSTMNLIPWFSVMLPVLLIIPPLRLFFP